MRTLWLATISALCVSAVHAHAVGMKTQLNCASDYYAYCSRFAVGSSELRKCMRGNGHRLSKACVNALIADGEISKAEVERTKEKLLSARTKSKAEPSRVAKAVEAPRHRKQTVAALPPEEPIRKEPRVTINKQKAPASDDKELVFDQPTIEALKSRGPYFLARSETPSAPGQPRHDEPSASVQPVDWNRGLNEGPSGQDLRSPGEEGQPSPPEESRADLTPAPPVTQKVGPDTSAGPKKAKLPAPEKAETVAAPRRALNAAERPPGKMSLGNKPSSAQEESLEPSNAQDWNDYMQSRFNGGMNYEGLGARFSKGR